ncbi:flavoprotein [Fimbriiglobus ruber]|uniref:Phosphopantothenoylcysteine decarboxylase n=1 Tax=Fimbriiglobus ruber TaxID=1908690 RepID=A0A225D5S2_9BACT|nr:flavoprotein [Fimbriiglobus ruber]OWK36323.1 Phosphopantothenoylcysteine decarboxylase [Fimbriiglobus ruber]OWK42917.1 Phosphopantothenoylcysteine decarboxylase [Fimbriiglobus ruber]
MSNILLGATGSVAAVRVPALYAALAAAGHQVKIVATDAATYFFDPAPLRDVLTLDADEWPGQADGGRYARGDRVVHIDLRDWADTFVIAPLDANTLAKLAVGLCDNCLTCVWRAWDYAKPVILAPAMNTLMWRHPFTRKHLRAVGADFGAAHVPGHLEEELLVRQINDRAKGLRIVAPIEKQLACGDVGVGAMAEVDEVVAAVRAALAPVG